MNRVQVINKGRSKTDVHYDRPPQTCPVCHHAISPEDLSVSVLAATSEGANMLERVYRCPRRECSHLFVARYSHKGQTNFEYRNSIPVTSKPVHVEDEVARISPAYETILSQAVAAEAMGLDEIAGVGFRKALEYLIKDFCCHRHPTETEKIRKKFLGVVIREFVLDPRLKQCAERAAWLGNDETHYIRKWEKHDIEDLKTLIRLTESWVLTELLTNAYVGEMSNA